MSRGPGIREIFSHKAVRKNEAFAFENQESKQQLKLSKSKDSDVPPSAMKKFGGYKPKILAGGDNFLEIQTYPSRDLNTTTLETKSSEQVGARTQPVTVTSKPWVIGDKNIPMVLGTIGDKDAEEDNNNNTETLAEDRDDAAQNEEYNNHDKRGSQRTLSISSETSTLVHQNVDDSRDGLDNPVLYANGYLSMDDNVYSTVASIAGTDTDNYGTDIDNYSTNRTLPDNHEDNEPANVYIPAPDYEDDEKTLDFNSEDTDDPSDGGDDGKPRQVKPKAAIKVYEGADLSHFLAEDETEQEVVLRNETKGRGTLGRNVKSETLNPKGSQKQATYKQQSPNKTKRKSKGNVPTFSSVRSFSYADSKFGAKEKTMGKSLSASNLPDDGEIFLSSHNQQSSYESFLKSRHADELPSDKSNVGGDNGDFRPSSKFKDDPVWKKLTLRLKRRISKSVGGKEQ